GEAKQRYGASYAPRRRHRRTHPVGARLRSAGACLDRERSRRSASLPRTRRRVHLQRRSAGLHPSSRSMKVVNVCVIGAEGVVGSAVLRELAAPDVTVIGLEKHSAPAQETSGRNSRVVHSGFHETAGTLKAQLALSGSQLLMEYASRKGIQLLRTGMLIAIP